MVDLVTFRVVEEYARERGVADLGEMQKYGMECVTATVAVERTRCAWGSVGAHLALLMKYYHPDGAIRDYCTARLIKGAGTFAEMLDKGAKGMNPKGQSPQLWFSPTIDWSHLPSGTEIQIHESVLKAINALKRGYIAIGLSGVWGFMSKQHRRMLIDDFELLPWVEKNLKVGIVFDAHSRPTHPKHNPQVGAAVNRLANVLAFQYPGLNVGIRYIPSDDEIGYDDWCAAGGGKWTEEPTAHENRQELAMVQKFNTLITYVHGVERIVTLDHPHSMLKAGDARIKYANLMYVNEEGDPKQGFEVWLRSTLRNECKELVYMPGEDKWQDGKFLNMWNGLGVLAVEGDTDPFHDLLGNLMADAEATYLLNWIAYLVQGMKYKKSTVIPILVGPQGIGKSSISAVIQKILGFENCSVIGPEQFKAQFNSYLAKKQFVAVEEMSKLDDFAQSKILAYATEENIEVNIKHQPQYMIRNTAAFFVTTNDFGAMKMHSDARRMFVPGLSEKIERRGDHPYWKSFWKWVNGAGPASLLWELERRDLSKWEAHAPAPYTEARKEMAISSHGAIYEFLVDLKESPGDYTERSVLRSFEIEKLYLQHGGGMLDPGAGRAKAIGELLKQLNVPCVMQGKKIKIDGLPTRFYIVRPAAAGWGSEEVRVDVKRFGVGVILKHE